MPSPFGISGDAIAATRLDLALTQPPFSLSRREAKRLLSDGRIVLDGRPVGVASREVHQRAHISIIAADVEVPILRKTSDLVFIDKPAAIPTQPSPGSSNPSLLEVLAVQLKRSGDSSELYLVHRLDTNTTGVILFARTRAAAERYTKVIQSGECRKEYIAIVEGQIEAPFVIDAPIGRVEGNLFGISPAGKPSRSEVTPLATTPGYSFVRVLIATGRTHQIRVHLRHAGFPVVGDRKYGGAAEEITARPMLHARALEHSALGKVEAPLPDDFIAALSMLGLNSL